MGASDDSEDSNYRPVGNNTRLKKRKKVAESWSSSDDENWRPGKDFPGHKRSKAGRPKKQQAARVTVGAPGEKRGRGRPPKAEGRVEKRGRPKKQKGGSEEEKEEEEEEEDEKEEEDKIKE